MGSVGKAVGGIVGGVTDAVGLTNNKGQKRAQETADEMANSTMEATGASIEMQREQLQFMKDQYKDWQDIYGDMQTNLNKYYKGLSVEVENQKVDASLTSQLNNISYMLNDRLNLIDKSMSNQQKLVTQSLQDSLASINLASGNQQKAISKLSQDELNSINLAEKNQLGLLNLSQSQQEARINQSKQSDTLFGLQSYAQEYAGAEKDLQRNLMQAGITNSGVAARAQTNMATQQAFDRASIRNTIELGAQAKLLEVAMQSEAQRLGTSLSAEQARLKARQQAGQLGLNVSLSADEARLLAQQEARQLGLNINLGADEAKLLAQQEAGQLGLNTRMTAEEMKRNQADIIAQKQMGFLGLGLGQGQGLLSAMSNQSSQATQAHGLQASAASNFYNQNYATQQQLAQSNQMFGLKPMFNSFMGEAGKGAAGGLTGSMFSDYRLKQNIRLVDNVDGFNIYEWSWNKEAEKLGFSGKAKGVIAQEILQNHSDKVNIDKTDYLVVDYSKLPITVQSQVKGY